MDREQLRNEIIEELKKEYTLTPIKEKRFTVNDILEKYYDDISIKADVDINYSTKQCIGNAIRKVVCLRFGVSNIDLIPRNKRIEYREELERLIKDYILGGKNG